MNKHKANEITKIIKEAVEEVSEERKDLKEVFYPSDDPFDNCSNMTGNCSNMTGNCSNMTGDCNNIRWVWCGFGFI